MTKRALFFSAFAGVLIVAALASYLTTQWHYRNDHHSVRVEEGQDFHDWLHTQLELTAEQDAALHPAEEAFAEQSAEVRERLAEASHRLAHAVKSGDPNHPEIESSLQDISSQQAKLKKLMLDHFFAMKSHLDPEQAEQVREWVHDSLTAHAPASSAHHSHHH